MKRKSIYLLAGIATTVFCLTSCKSDEMSEKTETPAELKIVASMSPSLEVSTRAAYDIQSTTLNDPTNIGIYVWYNGETSARTSSPTYAGYSNDKVDSYTGSGPYTLTPTTTPMYFPVDNADVDVYLYAPFKPSPTQTAMCMQHTVATDQSLTADYVASDFIYGKATADYDNPTYPKEARVTMYHAMSKIIFKVVNNGVSSNNMTNITLKNIYKTTTINMPQTISGSAPFLSCGSAASNNVAVATDLDDIIVWGSSGTGAVTNSDTELYGIAAIVPPQTTSTTTGSKAAVSITVDGKTATADFSGITLAPGYVYTYNLKLTGQTLTITLVSIVNWQSGGAATDLDFNNWS